MRGHSGAMSVWTWPWAFPWGVPGPRVAGLGPGRPEEGGAGAGRGQTLGLELDLSILATPGCILITLWYNYQFTTWVPKHGARFTTIHHSVPWVGPGPATWSQ